MDHEYFAPIQEKSERPVPVDQSESAAEEQNAEIEAQTPFVSDIVPPLEQETPEDLEQQSTLSEQNDLQDSSMILVPQEDPWIPNEQEEPQLQTAQKPSFQPYMQQPPQWSAQQPPQWDVQQPPQWGAQQPSRWDVQQPPQWGAQQPPQWDVQQPPQWGSQQPPQWGAQQPPQWETQQPQRTRYYQNGPYAMPQKKSNAWGPYGQMPPQPAYYPPAKPKEQKNVVSIVALVCSLVGVLLLNYLPTIGLLLGIAATCCGAIGLKQSNSTGTGKVCSIIGLVFGIFDLIVSVAMLVMMLTLMLRLVGDLGDIFKGFAR